MYDRFDGEIGQRLCVECDSILVDDEGDGVTMKRDHCGGCSESCGCPPEHPTAVRLAEPTTYQVPYWLQSGRHG